MSFDTVIDHWPVVMRIAMNQSRPTKKAPITKFDRLAMLDKQRVQAFREQLSRESTPPGGRPHDILAHISQTLLRVASDHFAPPPAAPKKSWISADAAQAMQVAWSAKDRLRDARWWLLAWRKQQILLAWKAHAEKSWQNANVKSQKRGDARHGR